MQMSHNVFMAQKICQVKELFGLKKQTFQAEMNKDKKQCKLTYN